MANYSCHQPPIFKHRCVIIFGVESQVKSCFAHFVHVSVATLQSLNVTVSKRLVVSHCFGINQSPLYRSECWALCCCRVASDDWLFEIWSSVDLHCLPVNLSFLPLLCLWMATECFLFSPPPPTPPPLFVVPSSPRASRDEQTNRRQKEVRLTLTILPSLSVSLASTLRGQVSGHSKAANRLTVGFTVT